MFLASNCTCAVYFTYTAHVPLLAKNMATTHVHAICIRNQTNILRFCREDNPLHVFTLCPGGGASFEHVACTLSLQRFNQDY